jgi:hypothetical protein
LLAIVSSESLDQLQMDSLGYCNRAVAADELEAAYIPGASIQVHGQARVSLAAGLACQQVLLYTSAVAEDDAQAIVQPDSMSKMKVLTQHRLLGELQGEGSTSFVGLLIALIVSGLLNALLTYKVCHIWLGSTAVAAA